MAAHTQPKYQNTNQATHQHGEQLLVQFLELVLRHARDLQQQLRGIEDYEIC